VSRFPRDPEGVIRPTCVIQGPVGRTAGRSRCQARPDASDGELAFALEADQILVVSDGRIVERGTHAQLPEAGRLYSELYRREIVARATRSSRPAVAVQPRRDRRNASVRSLKAATIS
jgi:hypothetical protein